MAAILASASRRIEILRAKKKLLKPPTAPRANFLPKKPRTPHPPQRHPRLYPNPPARPRHHRQQMKGLGVIYQCGSHLPPDQRHYWICPSWKCKKWNSIPRISIWLTSLFTGGYCRVKASAKKALEFHYHPPATATVAMLTTNACGKCCSKCSACGQNYRFGTSRLVEVVDSEDSTSELKTQNQNFQDSFLIKDTGIGIATDTIHPRFSYL